MAPHQHIAWFRENIEWFEGLRDAQLAAPVPNCPGWHVDDVVEHLAIGLGVGYSVAVAADPATPADQVFSNTDWPTTSLRGRAALNRFSITMEACAARFEDTDPETPCWTYAGPGRAAFWFRRAAIETALHRIDVSEAISSSRSELSDERTHDAIVETVDFALRFACSIVPTPPGSLTVEGADIDLIMRLDGANPPTVSDASDVTVRANGEDLLRALWGRTDHDTGDRSVQITGDQHVAEEWLTLVERAFAGR